MNELYQLPNGWEWKSLGDLAEYINGMAFKPEDFSESGFPIIRIQNLNGKNQFNYFNGEAKERYYVKNGDILISWSASLDVYKWNRGDAILNQHIFNTNINLKVVDYDFFYHIIKYALKEIMNNLHGVGMKHITKSKFENIKIPLPPLSEQQRIVSKLDSLFKKIDKSIGLHQKNMDEANAFMGSVLNEVFEELEEKHQTEILKNVLQKAQYGFSDKSSDDGMYPFLRMGDLQNGKVLLNNLKYVNLSKTDFLKYKLDKYDLLFNRTNSFELVGKTSIYENDMDMTFASYLVRLKVKKEKITPYFLNYFLNSNNTQNTLKEMATKAINQSNINAQKLQSISIPIPPLSIQQKVVEYLDSVSEKMEKVKSIQKEKMESLKALKASILDQAFRGEL